MSTEELTLAAAFPPATREQWQKLVGKVLAGPDGPPADPEGALTTHLLDGIDIAPLYTADDDRIPLGFPGQAPYTRGSSAAGHRTGWDVRQRHAHPDPVAAREQVMEDLENGVTSLWLGLGDGGTPVDALDAVLSDVLLDLAPVVLDAGTAAGTAADAFLTIAASRGVDNADLRGNLGFDPLGHLARTGEPGDDGAAATFAQRAVEAYPHLRVLVADGLPFHEAGATDVQELGLALASGLAHVRLLERSGIPLAAAFGLIEMRVSATADQFSTLAKMRAARRTWARIADACGVPEAATTQRIHAVSSWAMLSRRDPWNNILRGTLACFAAGVGGADAVTVRPFDAAIGLSDPLARRVARNTHALLVEESNVARVIDPAGGSWYVDVLTEDLARAAWAFFREIEADGGLATALHGGLVADRLAASRDDRRAQLAHQDATVTGVSDFPLAGEVLLERPAAPSAPKGGLPRIRWSQWHEAARDRADALTRAGRAPAVRTVTVGDPKGAARLASQLGALIAPGGLTATADATSPVAVICAADAEADDIASAASAARAHGATRVLLWPATGAPRGVDGSIERKPDVLALFDELLTALEAS